jgi:23S rRNA (adenine2503-C2)-methyltransferase
MIGFVEYQVRDTRMSTSEKIQIKNLSIDQFKKILTGMGEQKFRAGQIAKWIYGKRLDSFSLMGNIPKALRDHFTEIFSIQKMEPLVIRESKYGDAVKFGFNLVESPHIVESVLLMDENRRTACLSSQLGCGLGCIFCETAKMGFIRNLTQEEILGQLIGINDYLALKSDKEVTNIVFMGMGEALSNFENFRSSLRIIMDEEYFGIGGRKINVSTAGVIPSIERLMAENLNLGLAISLNSYSNESRNKLMPINESYPIEMLVAISRRYFEKTGRRVTFEYVVIDGETNTSEALTALEKLLGGLPCKINLIPVNPSKFDSHLKSPSDNMLMRFSDELEHRGLTVTVRKSRGQDIGGACGQLAVSNIDGTLINH